MTLILTQNMRSIEIRAKKMAQMVQSPRVFRKNLPYLGWMSVVNHLQRISLLAHSSLRYLAISLCSFGLGGHQHVLYLYDTVWTFMSMSRLRDMNPKRKECIGYGESFTT